MKTLEPIQFHLSPFKKATYVDVSGWVKPESRVLRLVYHICGDLNAICWPEAKPGRGQNLWQHTCLECFISPRNQSNYWEYNFSTALQWDVRAFSSYRQAIALNLPPQLQPELHISKQTDQIQLEARIPLDQSLLDKPLDLGISAVMLAQNQDLVHYALLHTGERPDFHARDSFLLKL